MSDKLLRCKVILDASIDGEQEPIAIQGFTVDLDASGGVLDMLEKGVNISVKVVEFHLKDWLKEKDIKF